MFYRGHTSGASNFFKSNQIEYSNNPIPRNPNSSPPNGKKVSRPPAPFGAMKILIRANDCLSRNADDLVPVVDLMARYTKSKKY